MWSALLIAMIFFSDVAMARDPFQLEISALEKSVVEEHWVAVHHQPVQRVSTLLSSALGKLGPDEIVVSDDLRNGLSLHLTPQHWQQARRYLPRWDAASTQVDMVAYIVDMDSSVIDEWGIKWQTANKKTAPSSKEKWEMNLPPEQGNTIATVHIGVLDRQVLALQLSALEQAGRGSIIARPHMLVEDYKEAVIEAGTEIPYAEKTRSGATNIAFKKAVLRLKVRPRCLPDHRLLLALEVNHDKVSTLNVQGTPAIETQSMITEVAVSSGQTVVLGGLFTVTETKRTESLPWLGQIPGIGVLFRWQTQQLARKELVVFISPSIL